MLNLAVRKINDWALKAELTGVCDWDKECSLWSGNLLINVARMNIMLDGLNHSVEICCQFFICSKAEEFHGRRRPTCPVAGTCRCVLLSRRCVRQQKRSYYSALDITTCAQSVVLQQFARPTDNFKGASTLFLTWEGGEVLAFTSPLPPSLWPIPSSLAYLPPIRQIFSRKSQIMILRLLPHPCHFINHFHRLTLCNATCSDTLFR